ncbi:hypothetical protein [Sulfurimonas sp. CS5]|jgi:hypothetical protein|uniref:hypothetical protein n=1 Tax=Sulfurimonas sp. CS5 TaxID=3391145 RepID=UPI0039EC0702
MKELNLPHQEPLKFARYIVSKDDILAVVKVQFNEIPTLPMLVEAAAQSSAAFDDGDEQVGFLVTLKNIKLLNKPIALEYDIKVIFEYQLDSLTYFKFEVYDKDIAVSNGIFIIALQ